MPLFGDEKTFGIKCSANEKDLAQDWTFIHCHLLLGGQYIGDPEETDVLGVSASHLERLRNQISGDNGNLSHPLFQSLTDKEIFELILKSNQMEEEFNPNFAYLPALENEGLFGTHHILLGESTDAYLLLVIEQSQQLKFLWRNLRTKEDQTHAVVCNREVVMAAINECLNYLKQLFPGRIS